MRHPECSFDIMTADGRVQLTPEDIQTVVLDARLREDMINIVIRAQLFKLDLLAGIEAYSELRVIEIERVLSQLALVP